MLLRMLSFGLVTTALALFVSVPVSADDTKDSKKARTHEGTVVSVNNGKLVMKSKSDDSEHTHTLAQDAQVWCDGKECKIDDLKPGQKIRVTTQKGNNKIAVKIEALDKNQNFDKDTDKDSDK